MKVLLAFAFAALFAVESFGVDAVWTNTATAVQNWYVAANWTNETGEVLVEPPTGAEDTATFPHVDYTLRSVNLMDGGKTASIASLSGAATWRLYLNDFSSDYGNGGVLNFGVGDVNGFLGEWYATGSKKTLVLTAESGVQTLRLAHTAQQFSLKVENAAVTADILQLRGTAGSLKKSGAGDLRVREVAEDGNLVLELEEGNVQIDGVRKVPLADDAAVLRKAAVHLDASVADTWQEGTYVDDDGRTRVTKWYDVHGNGAFAEIWDNSGDKTESHLKTILPPFISATRSSTGLTLMDFGACSSANVGTYGPQAVMRLGSQIAAQEVFFVSALNDGTAVLGDSSDTTFNAGGEYVFTRGAEVLKNGGFARFNGNLSWQNLRMVSNIQRMVRTFDSYTSNRNELMLTNVRFGDGNAKPVRYLASDRLYASAGNGSGGVKIGELLVFTEALTEDERKEVTDYLMRKWFVKADHKDFHLANAMDGTSITVPEGRVARIDTLRINGTTFTKKGGGTLQVGRVYPEDLTIAVEGGDVKLNTTVATETVTEPVGTPQFWFDADYDETVSFIKNGEDVTNWCDRRGTGNKTVRLYFDQITAYPQVDVESRPGRTVLSFPDKAAMQMPSGGQRESFVVFSYPDNVKDYNVLANGYSTDRSGGGNSSLFAKYDVGPDGMGGGIYSVNGKPVRPFEATGKTFVIGEWYVAHLSTSAAYTLDRIASNGPRTNAGHVKIGEIITYTTALTPEERRQNIDYLMKKWLGLRHPEFAVPAKDITVAFAGDATVASDTDATYAEVTGSGSLVKTDAGQATVSKTLAEDFQSLSVEGGTLVITKETVMPDRSQFHFDAMDTDSYAEGSYVDDEGETRVNKWLDVRRNGVFAETKPTETSLYVTNPIVRQVVCKDGVTRPIFDFLENGGRNVQPPKSAALAVSPAPATSCEAICVYADNVMWAGTIDVFGTTDSNVSYFKRGLGGTLFRTNLAHADVQNGYIWVDGAPGSSGSNVSGGKNDLHVVHIAPANEHKFPMGAIGYQGSNDAGGRRYGEYMAFDTPLTEKERNYINGHLMYKWMGAANDAVWTNDLKSVAVAEGASLVVSGGGAILAPTVTGGGTIEATRIMGIAALNLKATDRTTVEGLTIEGVADFADAVAVTLTGTDAAKLKAGKYALVTATSFANLDLAQWTLTTQLKNGYRFVQEGNTVFLEVQPNGSLFIVR